MRIVSESIISVVSSGLNRSALVISSLIASRLLAPESYGEFIYIASVSTAIATIATLGGGVVCNKTASSLRRDAPSIVLSVLILTLAANLLLSAGITFLTIGFITGSLSLSGRSAFVLVLVLAAVTAIASTTEGILYGLRELRKLFLITLVALIASISLAIYLTLTVGLVGALFALTINRTLICALAAVVAINALKRSGAVLLRGAALNAPLQIMKSSMPALTGAAMLAGPIITIGLIVLERSSSLDEVASFGLGFQFFVLATFVPSALGHFVLSRSAATVVGKKVVLGRSMIATLIWGLASLIFFWNLPLVTKNISPHIIISAGVSIGLGLASLFFCLSAAFNAYWPSIGLERNIILTQVVWAVVMLATTLLLAGDYGAGGLVIALAAAYFCQAAANVFIFFGSEGDA